MPGWAMRLEWCIRPSTKCLESRMNAETHSQLANFIWSICNLLRGPYKRNEYRKVILPLTVLRRFDCLLEPTKAAVLAEYQQLHQQILSERAGHHRPLWL